MSKYYGVISAETLREIEDREYSLLLREQLAEIDDEIKIAVIDDPTIYEIELEYDEVFDETLESLVAAGYDTHVRASENEGMVILTISWDARDDDDDCCCCDPCC